MAANPETRQHAHELIDQLGPSQLVALVQFLESVIDPDEDEPLTEEDRRGIREAREYFKRNPDGGIPFERVVADLGFTMDQIRNSD